MIPTPYIKATLKHLPDSPGVYRSKWHDGFDATRALFLTDLGVPVEGPLVAIATSDSSLFVAESHDDGALRVEADRGGVVSRFGECCEREQRCGPHHGRPGRASNASPSLHRCVLPGIFQNWTAGL